MSKSTITEIHQSAKVAEIKKHLEQTSNSQGESYNCDLEQIANWEIIKESPDPIWDIESAIELLYSAASTLEDIRNGILSVEFIEDGDTTAPNSEISFISDSEDA